MFGVPVRVLVVEDDLHDARCVKDALTENGAPFGVEHAGSLRAALQKLRTLRFDAVLLDPGLPDSQELATLAAVASAADPAPIVVLANAQDVPLALRCRAAGAADHLLKDQLFGSVAQRTVRYAIERAQAQRALRRSDERWRMVARASRDWLWDYSVATDTITWSENALASLGYGPGEAPPTLAEWLRIVHPDDRPRFEESFDTAIRSGTETWAMEYRVFRRDGTVATIYDRGALLGPPGAPAEEMVGAVMDLSDLRGTEAALQEWRERYRRLFDTMAQGVVLWGRGGELIESNPAVERILDVPGEQLRTRHAADDVWNAVREDGSPLPPHERPTLVALRTGQEADGVMGITRGGDGERRWLLVHARPQFLPGAAEPYQAFATYTDITALRQAEAARRASEAALRASEERLNRIIQTVVDGVLIFDVQGRIVMANPAAEAALGLPREVILSRGFDDDAWEIRAPDGSPVRSEELPVARVLATGAPVFGREHTVLRADGGRVVISVNAAPLRSPSGEVEGVVLTLRDVTEMRAAAERLRFQAFLLDAAGEAVSAMDREGRVIYLNRQAEARTGWSAAEVIGRRVDEISAVPESMEVLRAALAQVIAGERWRGELTLRRRDGSTYPAFVTAVPLRDERGRVTGVVSSSTDLSEVKRLQQQLHQAQRMEAVGRLAGGVAHDFNNILTGIQGYAQFVADELRPGDPARADVEEILKAGERAAALTRQLLAFSRKQVLNPRVLDLGAVLRGMENMLRRLIGEDVELSVRVAPDLGRVMADPGQIEQVVMNLAVNARDAMPAGGRLSLELRNAGGEVLLRVRDTGSGIPADVLPHVFEPFFTTKATGQGTGLGLSTVYGIVTQSGGTVQARSEAGEGTAFDVRLPRVEREPDAPAPAPPALVDGGSETVLLAEDEDAVRVLAARMLRRLGYTVLEARNGGEALLLCERHDGPIHLLMTDVVMPGMSGGETAARLMALRPEMRVLYVSGYPDDVMARHGILERGQPLLEKPYTPVSLATRVRELLDG